MERAGMGAGVLSGCVLFRRLGVELAVVTVSVRRVWGRAAVAFVAALAAACVCVPAAQAWSKTMQIAFQANTGNLWNWTINDPGSGTPYGMAAGTSPSEAPSGFGWDHEIAFQANTGALWTTGSGGQGATPYGMAAGTSPSIGGSEIAFQANGGDLWTTGTNGTGGDGDTGLGMMAGTSPSMAGSHIAFQSNTGELWGDLGLSNVGPVTPDDWMAPGTSPSVNEKDVAAFQEAANVGSNLWTGPMNVLFNANDTGLGMMPGTSPSINDNNDVAYQGSNGDLWVICCGGGGDTGAKMLPGTSPSIDDQDDIAFQGSNGDLWIWIAPASGVADGAHDLQLGMNAGTSPSISRDPGLVGGARPQTSQIGGPGSNRLNGGRGNDLIAGGRGNDRISGGRGNDQLYGGPGSDRIFGGPGNDQVFGGPGNDRIYGEAGNDRIVDHGGATTVFPGSGTNRVDVADRHGDDRVECAPGSTNHIVADRGDRIARSCRGKRSTIRVQQPRSAH